MDFRKYRIDIDAIDVYNPAFEMRNEKQFYQMDNQLHHIFLCDK